MATLRFLWLNWQYYLKPCLCRKSCRSVAALLMKIFQRRWRPQIRVKKSFQLSWCMYFWPYVVCGADNPPRDRGGRFKNPVDVCHTWVTCGLHYSWVIPARLVMCVILGHEKCKIQDIMDCEKIRGSVRYLVWVRSEEQNIIYTCFKLRILLKQNTALLSTVRPFVTGVTSHIFQIHKGINASLMISWSGDPSNPLYSESKSSWLSF